MIKPFCSALSTDDERWLCASFVFLLFKTAKFVVRKQIFPRTLQCFGNFSNLKMLNRQMLQRAAVLHVKESEQETFAQWAEEPRAHASTEEKR